MKVIEGILDCGCEIGLHFDEVRYPEAVGDVNIIRDKILEEVDIFSKIVGMPVTKFSIHRPSKEILGANLKIPGLINTYSDFFYNEFKYVSDSRHLWREPVEDIIGRKLYNRIQILTHPFWYNRDNISIKEMIKTFVNNANKERYQHMDENISDLHSIMSKEELYYG